ncbi:MAG: phage tail protein [Clostridia bacterium]|nr:phage tail protein [Clostridia bacterium]
MVVGSLGENIIFEVSPEVVKTLDNIKWSSSAEYSTINRYIKDDLIEFAGNKPEKITFTVRLSAALGINPLDEMVKFLEAKRKGLAMRFVIGWKAYGKYKWVIESLENEMKYYDPNGNLLYCDVSVTLLEYAER